MLTFLLEVYDYLLTGSIYLFMFLYLAVILLWIGRIYLSRGYTPFVKKFSGTAGVLIPVVDEDPEIFRDVLSRVKAQKPNELLVVINGARNTELEQICSNARVDVVWNPEPSKRKAIAKGFEKLTSDVIVLLDSDTVWTDKTLVELLKPFSDGQVGGVTTRQKVFNPGRSFWTRWANWLESVRSEYSMPAMSQIGTVGCLPGRTIAFRRSILEKNMHRFLNEKFLGVHQEISDDRTLTNYALIDGWKTVFQRSSLVLTDAPTGLQTLVKQQYRWAKGSQYNTLRMLGWMLRKAPWLALYYAADVLIPFVTFGVLISWFVRWAASIYSTNVYLPMWRVLGENDLATVQIIGIAIVLSWLFAAVRFSRVVKENPAEFWMIPLYLISNTLLMMPIRILGFFECGLQGAWGTRGGAYESQTRQPLVSYTPMLIGSLILASFVAFGLMYCSN